jgi:branched-chain amino acid transport system ATP-binding protein
MTVGGSKPEQLVAEAIRVHFEGVKAVDGVDLTLEQGQIMGLIGPNGAGKTTFMNAVSHFVPRTSGTVVLGGRDVFSWQPHTLSIAGLLCTYHVLYKNL